jgi:mannosyltransferase OCH1-like enzyme
MPDLYRRFGEEWIALNPGWELRDWGYEDLPPLQNQAEFDSCGVTWTPARGDAKEATMIQVTQADIAAYEILYNEGGLYLNCDMKPIRALPTDFCDREALLAYEVDGWLISNAFMAAVPQHPLMTAVIEAIPESVHRAEGRSMDWVTGPKLLTAVKKEQFDHVEVWTSRYCNPFMPNQQPVIFEETVAAHFWGHAMRDEELWPNLGRQEGAQRYN